MCQPKKNKAKNRSPQAPVRWHQKNPKTQDPVTTQPQRIFGGDQLLYQSEPLQTTKTPTPTPTSQPQLEPLLATETQPHKFEPKEEQPAPRALFAEEIRASPEKHASTASVATISAGSSIFSAAPHVGLQPTGAGPALVAGTESQVSTTAMATSTTSTARPMFDAGSLANVAFPVSSTSTKATVLSPTSSTSIHPVVGPESQASVVAEPTTLSAVASQTSQMSRTGSTVSTVDATAEASTVAIVRLNSARRPPVVEDPLDSVEQTIKEENENRRELVKSMTHEAWLAYRTHTWGHGEFDFRHNACYGWFGRNSGYTIVASMSTLWIMELKDEFERGRKWIETKLNFEKINSWAEVSRTVNDYIGGLLSCHALTDDVMFLEKAKQIAIMIEPAYTGINGLPYRQFNPRTKATSGALPFLSMIASGIIEYRYLTDLTGDQRFNNRIVNLRKFLKEADKPQGLYPEEVDVESGRWKSSISSLFFSGKCLYINLLAAYIQSDRKDVDSFVHYITAIDAIQKVRMVGLSRKANLRYARDYHYIKKFTGDFMDCAGLYLGAMFALGAKEMENAPEKKKAADKARITMHWKWAREITETGRFAAAKQKTGLPPSRFHFPLGKKDESQEEPVVKDNRQYNKEFHLSGELAESYFILYRLTHEQKYRDYAWQLVQSIREHCRNTAQDKYPGSYSTLRDVTKVPAERTLYQSVDLLSITFKYLYLIFCEDDVMPLEQWIFNATGQPLPIRGKSPAYKL